VAGAVVGVGLTALAVVIAVFVEGAVEVPALSGVETAVTAAAVVAASLAAVPAGAVRKVSAAESPPPLSPELRPSRNAADSPAMARTAASGISQRLDRALRSAGDDGLRGGGGGSSDTWRCSQNLGSP
jgi:hypothetical protein